MNHIEVVGQQGRYALALKNERGTLIEVIGELFDGDYAPEIEQALDRFYGGAERDGGSDMTVERRGGRKVG